MTAAHASAFRLAAASDLEALVQLERGAFDDPWARGELAAELARPEALVLVSPTVLPGRGPDGGIAGYLSARRTGDEAEVLRLAVAPERRREGLATALLEHALRALRRRGVESCFLEVREDNVAAIRFYEAAGFAAAGRRPRYYRDGCAALLLSRRLTPPVESRRRPA